MTDWRPPHAYVPGVTARHAEDLFDDLKRIDGPLDQSRAWQAGRAFLTEGFFWEAHEVLEAVWMAARPNSAEKCLVQGLIQIANARLKTRMGQPRAALRLRRLAERDLAEAFRRGGRTVLGLEHEAAVAFWQGDAEKEHYNAKMAAPIGANDPGAAHISGLPCRDDAL